jgi:hypothetical protein
MGASSMPGGWGFRCRCRTGEGTTRKKRNTGCGVDRKKFAIRSKGLRGTKRIITPRNLFLPGYGIARASSLRVAQKPITGRPELDNMHNVVTFSTMGTGL